MLTNGHASPYGSSHAPPNTAGYWREIFKAYKRSGQTRRVFCAKQQINFNQFVYWRRKLHLLDQVSEQAPPEVSPTVSPMRFIPVQVDDKVKAAPSVNHLKAETPTPRRLALHLHCEWEDDKIRMDVTVSTEHLQKLIQLIGGWYAELNFRL